MKKMIYICLIAIAVVSTNVNATKSDKKSNEPSYACKVMQERGSYMFCRKGD